MSIPNLLQNANKRFENSALMTNVFSQMEHIKTCCYFFGLEIGCKIIVLLETVCSLWKIYYAGKEVIFKTDYSLSPIWIDSPITEHNKHFEFVIGLIGFFSAQLLLTGVILKRKICVLLWVYSTLLITLVFMFITLVIDCIPNLMLLDVLTVGLQAYFIVIALAFYVQMQRAQSTDDDFQVLFTASEA